MNQQATCIIIKSVYFDLVQIEFIVNKPVRIVDMYLVIANTHTHTSVFYDTYTSLGEVYPRP